MIKYFIASFLIVFNLTTPLFSDQLETRTKVVCTLGPASNTTEKLGELMDAGMNVARLNFSHGEHEEYTEIIKRIKAVREAKGQALAILLDTKGPEIRTGQLPDGQMTLEKDGEYWLVETIAEGSSDQIPINPPSVLNDLDEGATVLFDDGAISSTILAIEPGKGIRIKINNEGTLLSRKGINVPNATLNLPNVTEQDEKDIRFGCGQGVDIVALSFTRSANHVREVREILASEGREDMLIIAKIENWQGIENLDSIIQAADGIMVARGDLGVELPMSQVPQLQKTMIHKCFLGGKPSITATQMLESMIKNPRPTRAEVSDVANAIYESTSAVMLSGETAVGSYPIECVQTMRLIIWEAEKNFDFDDFLVKTLQLPSNDVNTSIATAAVRSAYNSRAKAIFALTENGDMIPLISRLRPPIPIFAFTSNPQTYTQMALYWGVTPVLVTDKELLQDPSFTKLSDLAVAKGFVQKGDLVVITKRANESQDGSAGMMIIQTIGEVAFRGDKGFGDTVSAVAINIASPDKGIDATNKVVVMPLCHAGFEPIVKQAAGVVLQHLSNDQASETAALELCKKYNVPLITGVDSSCHIRNGQLVTLEPEKAVGYYTKTE